MIMTQSCFKKGGYKHKKLIKFVSEYEVTRTNAYENHNIQQNFDVLLTRKQLASIITLMGPKEIGKKLEKYSKCLRLD